MHSYRYSIGKTKAYRKKSTPKLVFLNLVTPATNNRKIPIINVGKVKDIQPGWFNEFSGGLLRNFHNRMDTERHLDLRAVLLELTFIITIERREHVRENRKANGTRMTLIGEIQRKLWMLNESFKKKKLLFGILILILLVIEKQKSFFDSLILSLLSVVISVVFFFVQNHETIFSHFSSDISIFFSPFPLPFPFFFSFFCPW